AVCSKKNTPVLLFKLGLVDWVSRKVDAQHRAISHSRLRSRSFKFRWEHTPWWVARPTGDLTLNGLRRYAESRSPSHSEITDQDSSCKFACFGMKPRLRPEMVNSAQTSESHGSTKEIVLKGARKSRNPSLTRAKEKFEDQYERQAQSRAASMKLREQSRRKSERLRTTGI